MNAATQRRDCPFCSFRKRRVLFHQQFHIVDEGAGVSGYDVVVCGRCGAGYADGIPDQETFDRYYREMSKYEYAQRGGAESPHDTARLRMIAEIIAPYVPSADCRILDVGCASGRLLSALRDLGLPHVLGLDPSPACAAAAASLYQVAVRSMTLAQLTATGEQFDFVIMVGVLEHLRDLSSALQQLRSLEPVGGRLYIEVPDVTAFADWPNAPYQDFSTEHINFFSPSSLNALMHRHGFRRLFLERNHRQQSHATVMSNISAVYEFAGGEQMQDVPGDTETADGLERYIRQCAAQDAHLRGAIDRLVEQRRPIIVWGVGTHTSRLLATSRLAEAEIVAFIESNSRYHGRSLHGRPILNPAALKERSEPVLISSRVFQHEITAQIRNELGCNNELVLLYDV